MKFRYLHVELLILCAIFMAMGCSSSSENPVMPSEHDDTQVSTSIESNGIITGQSILGVWDITIDTVSMKAEATLPRTAEAIGDAFYVDISHFLTSDPCTDCLKITGIALDDDLNIVLQIEIKHPFEPTNRLDLHVFDTRVMTAWANATNLIEFQNVQSDISGDGNIDGPVIAYPGFLLNADGYTTLFDTIVEPALGVSYPGNLVPFINVFFDPSEGNYDPNVNPENGFTNLQNPTGHNVFAMGTETGVYDLVFSGDTGDVINLILAIDCAYGQSSVRHTRMEPRYFLPEFHRKEAYSIEIVTVENNLTGEDSSSDASFEIRVTDWQAGLTPPSGGFDPDTSPLDAIRHKSDVKQLIFDLPGLINAPQLFLEEHSGAGTFGDPYVFNVEIVNDLAASHGTYVGIVAVRDDMIDIEPGGGNFPPLGIERDGVTERTVRDFTAYNLFSIEVSEEVIPPPVAIISNPPNDITVPHETLVNFDGSTSTPGNLPEDNYEWDFDYDEINQIFTTDDIGKTSSFFFENTGTDPVTYVVAFRVTDTLMRTDMDTVRITVNPYVPPQWSDPVRLTFTQNLDDTISLNGDAIAVDSLGTAHVIYAEKAASPDPPNTFRIKYVNYDGMTVSDPVVISGDQPFNTPMFGLPQPAPQLPGPSLALDSRNELHAVWTDIAGIRYVKTTSGIWGTTIQTFNPDENTDIVPTIAVNGRGDVLAMWSSRRYTYTDNTKPMPQIHYAIDTGSGMSVSTLTEFNNIFGGEPYLTPIGTNGYAMIYADDNPSVPGSVNDFYIAQYVDGGWDTPEPIPLDNPSVLRGNIAAKPGSMDISIAWSDVLSSPTTLRYKYFDSGTANWSDDYRAYDDAWVLSFPSPVRLEVLSNGNVMMLWNDTIVQKDRCLWVMFHESDDESTILEQVSAEIDPINPVGQRQINSTSRDGAIHVIWQDLRHSTSPSDPKQEIYYAVYR